MGSIVLLGDSIFDNGAYTGGESDVLSHLRSVLPGGWTATSCAVDGATTTSMARQLARIPAGATHLAVAIGGNDALQSTDLLNARARSSADTLSMFAGRLDAFERSYASAIDPVVALGAPVVVCTIYNGALEPEQARLARVGLMMFNDTILRLAFERRLGVIELRTICSEPGDYANPIEPSRQGGFKIARAVARAVGALPSAFPPSRVWAS